ncbi:MAG: hypothetical protein NTZ05_19460, partial [Chloroflexi bacterium]|nr:hypothetical protein [Chloroflexota bacterium]
MPEPTPLASFTAIALDVIPAKVQIKSGDKQERVAGATLPQLLTAEVVNAAGQPLPNQGVIFTIAAPVNGAAATPLNGAATTNNEGAISATLTLGTVAGAYKVTAACADCRVTKTVEFSATATALAPAAIIAQGGDGQAGLISRQLPLPVVVTVNNVLGQPAPGVGVTFGIAGTGAGLLVTPVGAATQTNANGQIAANVTLGDLSGVYTVTATCNTCASKTATFTLTASAANKIVKVDGDGQTGVVSADLKRRFSVAVVDPSGARLPKVPVTFSIAAVNGAPGGAAGQVVTPATPVNTADADGLATALLTLGNAAGTYRVTAACACAGTGAVTTQTFAATALTPQTLAGKIRAVDVLGNPIALPAGTKIRASLSQNALGVSFQKETTVATEVPAGTNAAFDVPAVAGEG